MSDDTIFNAIARGVEQAPTIADLAACIADVKTADQAQILLYGHAAAEATHRLWVQADEAVKYLVKDQDETATSAFQVFLTHVRDELIDVGADDNWSGRTNDLKRVVFDAKRNWVRTSGYLI